jgi:hypothetical protein
LFVVRGSFVESPFFYGKRQTTHGKPKKKETGITAETFKDNSFYDKKLDKSIPKGYDKDRKLNIDFIF